LIINSYGGLTALCRLYCYRWTFDGKGVMLRIITYL
jgi:hypothetical protein